MEKSIRKIEKKQESEGRCSALGVKFRDKWVMDGPPTEPQSDMLVVISVLEPQHGKKITIGEF